MTNWPTKQLNNWPTDQLTNRTTDELANWPTDQLTNWTTDQLNNWPTEQLTNRTTDHLNNWPTGQLTNRTTDQLANRTTDQQNNWPTEQLTNWPTDQLANWPTGQLTNRTTDQQNKWPTDQLRKGSLVSTFLVVLLKETKKWPFIWRERPLFTTLPFRLLTHHRGQRTQCVNIFLKCCVKSRKPEVYTSVLCELHPADVTFILKFFKWKVTWNYAYSPLLNPCLIDKL